MGLRTVPVTFAQARAFVAAWHRHHRPPVGHKFSIGVADEHDTLVGVAIVGRPVARLLDDGHTLEVRRLCTDGHRNACSALYAAAWQAARALGYRRLVTYTQAGEGGASLRAVGWRVVAARPPAPGWEPAQPAPRRPRRRPHSAAALAATRLGRHPAATAVIAVTAVTAVTDPSHRPGNRARTRPPAGPRRPRIVRRAVAIAPIELGRTDTVSTPPRPTPYLPPTPPTTGPVAWFRRVAAGGWSRWRPGRVAALLCFVALAAAANTVTYHHPLVPVGFGLHATPVAFTVTVFDTPTRWLHQRGGQWLVLAAIIAATVVSAAVGGPFGLAWGIAYLAGELLGLATWRWLDRAGAHPAVVAGAAVLALLAEVRLYVWLLGPVAIVPWRGQLLGTAWALLAVAAPIAVARTAREVRHRLRAAGDRPPAQVTPPPDLSGPGRRRRVVAAIVAIAVFAASVAAANALTSRYGFIPVGLGLSATAGTYAAGFCLLARDWVHDAAGRVAVLAAIGAGGAASAVMAGPRLALASAAAFVLSELADLLVYQPLRRRGFIRAVVASNAVGAPVDTILFLALAGFPIWAALPGQLLAKATATAIPVAVVLAARALLRHRIRPQGA